MTTYHVRSRVCLPYLPYRRSISFSFQRSHRASCSFIPFYKATWPQIKRQPSANSPKTRPGNQILWRASLFSSNECHVVRVRVEYQQNSSKKIILTKRIWKVVSCIKYRYLEIGLSVSKPDIYFVYNLVLCGILNC